MSFETEHLKATDEIILQINSSLELSETMGLIYQGLKLKMPISFFIISAYSEKDDTVEVVYCVKNDVLVKEVFKTKSNNPNSLTAHTIHSRNEIIIHDLSLDFSKYLSGTPQLHGKEDLRCESVLMFPLIVQGNVIGLFSVQHESKQSYSDENVKLLRTLTPYIAIALNNAKIYSALSQKNKEIHDSINYARRLQEAILPTKALISQNISDHFILYKPKDVVAGDFYWAERIEDLFLIAVADCTGHGVPGAIVSMICFNALNTSVKKFGLSDPGKILNTTRELVIETFEKGNSQVRDGMDISLLCIDRKNQKAFWSGANNPLWFVQNGEFKMIKADKQPVGKTDHAFPFRTHQIDYQDDTTFYLFTDGLPDQFGGPNEKKYKYKQFEELLTAISNKPLAEQSDIINKNFEDWKGTLEQVDDICVIGLRI